MNLRSSGYLGSVELGTVGAAHVLQESAAVRHNQLEVSESEERKGVHNSVPVSSMQYRYQIIQYHYAEHK